MRFASFACGQQNFSFREWLLSHEKCENKSFSKIAYGTIPEDQVFEGEKEGIQIQTHWYMCLSADIRYTYDISSTRTITLQPDGGGLRRPNQTARFCCVLCVYRQSLFELFAVLQITCSKVHSQGTYVIQHLYLNGEQRHQSTIPQLIVVPLWQWQATFSSLWKKQEAKSWKELKN